MLTLPYTDVFNFCCVQLLLYNEHVYSGTPLNGHPSTADTCDITDNSECPDCISVEFNTFKPPQQRTPRYSV